MQNKVVFVNLRLTGGGSEKVMAMLASYYAEQNIETYMLLLQNEKRVYPVSGKLKVIECYCPMEGNRLLWHGNRLKTLRAALKKISPDTIISFMWDINLKVILASLGLKAKVIISERADPNQVSRMRNMKIAQKLIFPLADRAVFQTEQVLRAYPKSVRKKGIVIPNPVPEPKFEADGHPTKTIVAAGRLYEQKNFPMLLRAFAEFHRSHQDYRLVIYGEGKMRNELEALSRALKISEYVSLPGFVENVNEKMSKCKIYASSSNYEGISNSMLEAMAMGLPVVCTDCPVGGAAMAIENGTNGLLIKPGDASAMARAFSRIADEPQLAKHLSGNARKVRLKYSLESIAEKWMEL